MGKLPAYSQLVGRLRIRHFDFLDRLGRDPNLGRVSTAMNMAQSNATKMLQEIEATVGTALFIRNRRGMIATEAGNALIRRAALILSDLEAAHAELQAVEGGASQRIRLGVFPVVTLELLPSVYSRITEAFPNARLAIEEGDEARLSQRLVLGEIDMIIGRVEPEQITPAMSHRLLYTEATDIVCGWDNAIADSPRKQVVKNMAAAEWILPRAHGGAFSLVSSLLVNAGYPPPKVSVESISVLASAGLLSRTKMLGILPESVARAFERAGALKRLPVQLSQTRFPVGIIYRKEVEQTHLIRTLAALVEDSAIDL